MSTVCEDIGMTYLSYEILFNLAQLVYTWTSISDLFAMTVLANLTEKLQVHHRSFKSVP